jgi:multicomponent Na+:H+ antiporter subunit G
MDAVNISMTARIIIDVLMAVGFLFALAGVVGMLRMPDAYCRMQSSTNVATLGMLGAMIAALVYSICIGATGMAIKLGCLCVFFIITNPISSHAICKAAYKFGLRPKDRMVCDDYGEDLEND